jgi:small subunit ribosomal protein S18
MSSDNPQDGGGEERVIPSAPRADRERQASGGGGHFGDRPGGGHFGDRPGGGGGGGGFGDRPGGGGGGGGGRFGDRSEGGGGRFGDRPGGRGGRRDDRPMTVKGRLRAKARKKARKQKKSGFQRRKVSRFSQDKKIDFDYKDAKVLRSFLTETGKIIPRRISGIGAAQQRKLAVAIKRARHLALLPYSDTHQ